MTDAVTSTGRALRGEDAATDPPAVDQRRDGRIRAVWWWLAHVVVVAEIALATRNFAFFQDDFVFLGQARGEGVVAGVVQTQPLTLDYLRLALFEHFSPVTRFLFWMIGRTDDPLLVSRLLVLVLVAGVVCSWGLLNRVILGRTWAALLITMIAGQGLVLARLGGWTTAALNILPALALCALSFAVAIHYLRHHRSRWWAVASVMLLALAVFDYELAMVLPMFVGLWFLWCARENGVRPASRILRTLPYWTGLALVSGAAAWNFQTNYRLTGLPHASPQEVLETLWRSLSQGLFPAFLGVFSPAPEGPSYLALASLVVWLLAIVWGIRRCGPRILAPVALGVSGWLVCTLILGYSRSAINGPVVGVELFYAAVPLLVLMVGISEAVRMVSDVRAADRPPMTAATLGGPGRRPLLVMAAATLVSAVLTQVQAVEATDPGGLSSASARATRNFHAALKDLGDVTQVVSTPVDPSVVNPAFWPYNYLSRSVGLSETNVRWDWFGAGRLHRVDGNGMLFPVEVNPVGRAGGKRITSTNATPSRNGRCYTTNATDSELIVTFAEEVSGDNLTLLVKGQLSDETAVIPTIATNGTMLAATGAVTTWPAGKLRAVLFPAAPSIAALHLAGLKVGTTVCIDSVVVGQLLDVP